MPAYFPLFVDLSKKKILVYGAGKIATRRITGLLRYGATVTVIAPHIREEIRQLCKSNPGQLITQQRSYCMQEIQKEDTDYVLAATDNKEVNAAICQECEQKEIPVNNASDSSQCDFYFPALIEQDGLVIGVTSTDGNHRKVAQFCEQLRGKGMDTDR